MSGWKSITFGLVLGVSLLGNALTIGALIRLHHARVELMGDSAGVTLPRDMRRDLAGALMSHRSDLAPALSAVQNARRDAVLALTAKPYDAAKATTALDGLRVAVDGLMSQGQGVVLQAMGARNGG